MNKCFVSRISSARKKKKEAGKGNLTNDENCGGINDKLETGGESINSYIIITLFNDYT